LDTACGSRGLNVAAQGEHTKLWGRIIADYNHQYDDARKLQQRNTLTSSSASLPAPDLHEMLDDRGLVPPLVLRRLRYRYLTELQISSS
jgi:hypothetical protein